MANATPAVQWALASPWESPDRLAMRREEDELVSQAITTLPRDQREIIRLRTWDGLTFEQIAQRMGRSPDAVRMLWARIIETLNDALVHARGGRSNLAG